MPTARRGGTPGRASISAQPASRSKSGRTSAARQLTARAAADDLAQRLRGVQRTLRTELESRATLLQTIRAVNATLDPPRIAEAIVERFAGWLPAAGWAVLASDPAGRLAMIADRSLPSRRRAAAIEIARWVMAHGRHFLSANVGADSRVAASGAVAGIALPLVSRGRTIGAVVGLDGAPSARAPEIAAPLLAALGSILEVAAVALDNANRLKWVEALSVTDDLTNLYNSRYLNQALHRESKRAMRGSRPLSLLFLDLDGFKNVNDAHGHLLGSRALVETAEVIRSCSRETDFVARFGGDEFAVVLPDTGAQGAYSVAGRIRERLAAHRFLVAEGLAVRLTVSIGVATLPDAASSSDELIEAADAAMYRVKERGKNGIEAAVRPADS
ncbi:MAG: diguanylate cyclase [Vicinamibacterales bacterium]